MPIKMVDYHDILDETGPGAECVSCGAVHGAFVYRSRADELQWQIVDECDIHRPVGLKGAELRRAVIGKIPKREGWYAQYTVVEVGFCTCCIKRNAEWRFRGVTGWKAYRRVLTDGAWRTLAVPHSSDRPHLLAEGAKSGVKEQPE